MREKANVFTTKLWKSQIFIYNNSVLIKKQTLGIYGSYEQLVSVQVKTTDMI